MIRQLTSVDTGGSRTFRQAQALIEETGRVFTERMNDDLDVKGAFDGTRENLSRLMSLKRNGEFFGGDAGKLKQLLRKIDGVFRVFGG